MVAISVFPILERKKKGKEEKKVYRRDCRQEQAKQEALPVSGYLLLLLFKR